MAGKAKRLVDQIIMQRSNGDPVVAKTTTTKLLLKGIDVSKISSSTPDDPALLAKIRLAGSQLGVQCD